MKRETINLEAMRRYTVKGHEVKTFYGCRLYGENVPSIPTNVYRDCFFTRIVDYFTNEDEISRRILEFEEATDFKYEFVVLRTDVVYDYYDLSFNLAKVFSIEFTLKEVECPQPKKENLIEKIKSWFKK